MQGIGNCHYPFPQSESAKIDFFNTLLERSGPYRVFWYEEDMIPDLFRKDQDMGTLQNSLPSSLTAGKLGPVQR